MTRSVVHVATVPTFLNFVRGQLRHFQARGWRVHVLTAPGEALTRFGEQEGVDVHQAAMARRIAPLHDLRALLQMARTLRAIRPTIVHAHTPKAGLLAMLAALPVRSAVRIYQVRGLPLETAAGWRRVLLRTCERVTCTLAQRVLCDSASLQHVLLEQRLCRPAKCTVLLGGICDGVDAEKWQPSHVTAGALQALREQLHINNEAPIVGYVGRLARDKGIADLAASWQLLRARQPTAQLLVLGALDARDPAPRDVLEDMRADVSVHFLGRVADPLPYYALMDVLVLPSYREGFGTVLLEAAAMQRPVVATRVTGCVDAVQDGVTGVLVEPHSPRALANALHDYLSDPALRAQHGRAGRARMLRDFRQEPLWAACEQEYEKLLAARTAARQPGVRKVGRRGFDIAVASVLLVATAPVMAAIAMAVRRDLGSPILFRQQRAGQFGRPFILHKFRTMRDARDEHGNSLIPSARVTRFGRWLRSTSLDELPELWDVLRGRMSLVGPRPLLMEYLPRYTQRQARRHEVRPGITGWSQINGRNAISWEAKLEQDVWYVEHASPLLDLKILLHTVPQVLARRDTTPQDRLTPEPFYGNQA